MAKHFFRGTIPQLEVSGIPHWIEKDENRPALVIIHLQPTPSAFIQGRVKGRGGRSNIVTATRRTSQDKEAAAIAASKNYRIKVTQVATFRVADDGN